MQKFTVRLRRAILDCGLPRSEISRGTRVAESLLSWFVRGERGLSSESIDALLNSLNLEVRARRNRKGDLDGGQVS
jgi:hypothetical protein